MLEAITHALSRDYTILDNGQEVGSIVQSVWREKATLDLGGYGEYGYIMYHKGAVSRNYCLELNGQMVAEAQKSPWQHNYEIYCAEGQFSLNRRSLWSGNYVLLIGGQEAGSISRTSVWKRNVEAELPNVSPPIACFMIWLVIISWQEAQSGD